MSVTVTELGCIGHLIVGDSCRWRRHTQVGAAYRVSTLGDYYHPHNPKRQTVGSGPKDYFESMVFRTTGQPDQGSEGCGCLTVTSYSEAECKRYATAGEAQHGHEALVRKYRRLASKATA